MFITETETRCDCCPTQPTKWRDLVTQ